MTLESDDDLIGYALIHSKTERALFSVFDINRLLALAGKEKLALNEDSFVRFPYERTKPIVEEIRRRQASMRSPLPGSEPAQVRSLRRAADEVFPHGFTIDACEAKSFEQAVEAFLRYRSGFEELHVDSRDNALGLLLGRLSAIGISASREALAERIGPELFSR